MRANISIMRMRFQLLLQYRMAAVAGICTQFLFGFVRVMVYEGFFAASSGFHPMSLTETISYVWLGQAMLGLLPWNSDSEIHSLIRNGNVAYELCRPVDLYDIWYFRAVALRSAPTLLRCIPLLLITIWFLPEKYQLQAPASPQAGVAWFMTTIGAILLGAAITNLLTISQLWTISGEGMNRLIPAVVMMFSGIIVPIPLFPDWMQGLLHLLPFRGIVDTPNRFFVGHFPASELGIHLLHQLIWTVILVMLGRLLLNKGLKRVVIQGG